MLMLGSDMLYAPGNLTRYEPEGVAEPEPCWQEREALTTIGGGEGYLR